MVHLGVDARCMTSYLIKGKASFWQVCIGLEVHAQVCATSKLFSRSSTLWNAAPNANVSELDAALPGTLPFINSHVVTQAVRKNVQ